MADLRLPSGAYLIRGKKSAADACLDVQDRRVTIAEQDLQRRRERQIWWVEALYDYEDDMEEGAVYSIQSISDQEALDSNGWRGFGLDVVTYDRNGQAWQKWRIKRVVDDDEGEFYNIISHFDGGALSTSLHGSRIRGKKFVPESHYQRWEFTIPLVPIPPGWIQIRSAPIDGRQLLLQQEYSTSPPFLGPEIDPSCPLSKRTNWGSQWTFLLVDRNDGSSQNYWLIKNRLTGGFLGYRVQVYKNGREINVGAGWTTRDGIEEHWDIVFWMLKMHGDGFWSIGNKSNETVLESYTFSGGVGVRAEKKGGEKNDRWKWELV
ncbi:hypothetical protein RUND412_001333 [Rhizina undulata]